MEVNLSGFCAQLQGLPAEQALCFDGVSPYLLDHLLIPYMEDMDIYCEDLDYNAFTLQDFVALEEHVAHMEAVQREIAAFVNRCGKMAPSAKAVPAFC